MTELGGCSRVCAGPFFVAFPNLRKALEENIAIKTQARSCTILPNFIGCVPYLSLSDLVR